MIIKVCGMREAENICAIEQLGIDWMGFIFWPKSKRYVKSLPAYMPTNAKRVGVFVNEDIEQVRRIAHRFALDIIQLHGSESPDDVRQLQEWKTIKAFNIATADDLTQTSSYEGAADFFLFDTKAQLPGGCGQQFDWSVLDAYEGTTPFLLSGGIGPDDAELIRSFRHPRCIGIDLNSRFESSPAFKNVRQIETFIQNIQP